MFTTIYTIKRKGRTEGHAYQTKKHTPFHVHIRETYPDAETWQGLTSVITQFIPGMALPCLPIVSGGERIA